jgi:hypothetical protein
MTSKNQVSPVIRISRGERDASARATHLKAASKKYLETTIERKQMSTTTNFKRIALAAVAALGLGVLSSVPSQAAPSVTYKTAYDTTNGVQVVGGNAELNLVIDTATTTRVAITGVGSAVGLTAQTASMILSGDTLTGTVASGNFSIRGSNLAVLSETATLTLSSAVAGVTTVTLTPLASNGSPGTAVTKTVTWTTSGSLAPASVTLALNTGTTVSSTDTTVALSYDATASTNTVANIRVLVRDANSVPVANQSVAVTVSGPGLVSAQGGATAIGTATGRVASATTDSSGLATVSIATDGAAGVGTISVTAGTVTSTKSVTFTGAASTYTASTGTGVFKVGNTGTAQAESTATAAALNGGVCVALKDSSSGGVVRSSTVYAVSGTLTVATLPTAAVTTTGGFACFAVTGVAAGTSKITFANAATAAATTVTTSIDITVSTGVVNSITAAFGKTSYAPGEAGQLIFTLNNAAGAKVADGTYDALTSAGLTSSVKLSGNTANPGTQIWTDTITSLVVVNGVAAIDFFAPATGGALTIKGTTSSTNSTTMTAAARGIALAPTTTVTDSGAAALAAVTALATTVASLRTLIVTLTNLVLKIQKKVRA